MLTNSVSVTYDGRGVAFAEKFPAATAGFSVMHFPCSSRSIFAHNTYSVSQKQSVCFSHA